ncbi:MAG TPA: ImmA/IrrE family metallo-endopeptidase, partial [Dehalococcoidia bacterium]|nr:ImmA/IrrE family metallo-endopeptidase [Dehalococcoidia bacterium]
MPVKRWRSRAAHALCGHAGVADPIEAMHRLADSLLTAARVTEPPSDIELLASLRGVRRIEAVDMSEAGMLVPDGAGYVVRANQRHPATRQRFTVAHEVAHTFFNEARAVSHQVSDMATSLYDDSDEEEYLCDVGAGRLLLNPRWLRPMVEAERPSLDALLRLASCCLTSIEATAIQVSQLGLWECSFVFWEPGLRKAERVRSRQ